MFKMESTSSKTEVMKPLFIKAGIPLVLSVAGFVYARIVLRRSTTAKRFPLQTTVSPVLDTIDSNDDFIDEASIHSLQSTSSPIKDDDQEHMITSSQVCSSTVASHIHFEEEILGLRNEIEELQKREHSLAMHFLRYRVMKEQDSVLEELKNMLLLETARVEFLDREISLIEAQTQGFENFMVECRRVLEQTEFAKKENRLLERKVKKLSRRTREQSRVIGEKNARINGLEAEIMRFCDALEMRTNVIKKLDDEVREFESVVNRLQEEMNDLLVKLDAAESPASLISKIEAEGIGMEDYNRLVNELEQLHKDRAAETTELIYLRWSNACLRHELMRSHGQQQLQIEDKKNYLELELEVGREIAECDLEQQQQQHEDPCLGVASSSKTYSKRKRLLKKLKKWVEGGDEGMQSNMDEKGKHEINCFGRHSVSEGAEEDHLMYSRRSCSSA
ncbi:PREDICTED: protein CHUP1, chloroplastic [Populus euphratica]|uniref:Protein CHUP1, chloroplastic n=1 Tax=Populus euphratica TaxID=75702 RepID=A0AAJ6U3Y8_POPEU|nr:PREDICTED: protein CHUP1, chloroplastic [Populus euphratica]XP_011022126.1 PREDICTED: protein CHUP1, chloroplastic [Populus euphratica]